jgi:hypothetical protein
LVSTGDAPAAAIIRPWFFPLVILQEQWHYRPPVFETYSGFFVFSLVKSIFKSGGMSNNLFFIFNVKNNHNV